MRPLRRGVSSIRGILSNVLSKRLSRPLDYRCYGGGSLWLGPVGYNSKDTICPALFTWIMFFGNTLSITRGLKNV